MKITKRSCSLCLLLCGTMLFVTAFFLPGLIGSAINHQIPSQIVMSKANYQIWGEVPGALNVTATVNFTFFNFTNPFEALYLNQTPEFVQTTPCSYQIHNKFLEANFSGDSNEETVTVHPYQWYTPLKEECDLKTVTVSNLGPLFAWYTMKNFPRERICLESLVSLANGFEHDLPDQMTAQAVWGQFVQKDKQMSYKQIFSKVGVSQEDFDIIWSDGRFGWSQPATFQPWVSAAKEGLKSVTSQVIMEHFALNFQQMFEILEGHLKSYIQAMDATLSHLFNCSTIPCDPKMLGALQWSQQGVGLNLPAPTNFESIFTTGNNSTLSGFPEISYYQKKHFPLTVSDDPIYQNVTFSVSLATRLLNRTNVLHHWLRDWNVLIHSGNLAWIFSVGDEYLKTKDLSAFQPLVERFELDSLHQAHILVSYLDYLVNDFSTKKSENGTTDLLIGGYKTAKMIYTQFVGLQEFLPLHLTALYVKRNASNLNLTCEKILEGSMNIGEHSSAEVCKSLNFTAAIADSITPIKQLINSCWYQEGETWNRLLNETLLNKMNLQTICFDLQSVFNQLLTSAQEAIYEHYNCTSLGKRCNKFQMAVMQWGASNITTNVPSFLASELQNSTSVSDWDQNAFPKPIEFVAVMKYFSPVFKGTVKPGLTYNHSVYLLDFEHLFNSLTVRQVFLDLRNSQMLKINDFLQADDPWPLIYYIRYMMIEMVFGGFTQTRTIRELLWGYPDAFLTDVATSDPVMQSGDPSIRKTISLIPNGTLETARDSSLVIYTGVGNVSKVRAFKSINGYDYITAPAQKFNGNDSYSLNINPWKMQVPFAASDGAQNAPHKKPNDTLLAYNIAALKTLECEWDQNESFEKNGMSIRRYKVNNRTFQSSAKNPENAAFYMDRWDGVINMTSVQGAPVFLSKLHYLDADPSLGASVNIYGDEAKTLKVTPSQDQDSYFDIEPNTGVMFQQALNLQTGHYIKGDELYPMEFDGLFPVFAIQGGGGLSDETIQTMFGFLKTALKIQKLSLLIGLIISLLMLCIGAYLYIKSKPAKTTRDSNEKDLFRRVSLEPLIQSHATTAATSKNNFDSTVGLEAATYFEA